MDVHFADHGLSTSDHAIRRESFRELLSDVHYLLRAAPPQSAARNNENAPLQA